MFFLEFEIRKSYFEVHNSHFFIFSFLAPMTSNALSSFHLALVIAEAEEYPVLTSLERRFLVFVSPKSGPGKSLQLWQKIVEPLFKQVRHSPSKLL